MLEDRQGVPLLMPKKISQEEKDATYQLWIEYKTNPTESLQTRLLEKYTPLVHKIAGGFTHKRPSVLDYDDLIQAGRVGLLDAIEKFDPDNERGAQFQTYATFRVRGAILDEINHMDWTPRSVRQNIKEVIRSIESHYTDTGTEPTVEEIAANTSLDEEETRLALIQMQKTYMVHADREVIEIVSPTTDADKTELESIIKIAMDKVLTEVEKDYISMKYFMGYNNREIQEVLFLKPTELKNIRESAIEKLTLELDAPDED